jgi:hypothetical protein
MSLARALALAFTFAAAVAAHAGCQDLPPVVPCGRIPDQGCPIGRGGTCDDPVCAALYDCVDGKWTSVQTCGSFDGGTDSGSMEAGPCTPTGIDTTGATTGCTPDLQSPDCPAEAAEPCAETACLTGCLDFFLCTKDGWTAVAHCSDDGVFSAGN